MSKLFASERDWNLRIPGVNTTPKDRPASLFFIEGLIILYLALLILFAWFVFL